MTANYYSLSAALRYVSPSRSSRAAPLRERVILPIGMNFVREPCCRYLLREIALLIRHFARKYLQGLRTAITAHSSSRMRTLSPV